MTLYEITEDFLNLLAMAEDPDVDADAIADTMEAIEGELEDKAEGYAKVLRELEAQTNALKAEIDRLTARKKVIENSIARIKNALETAMRATGKTKFKTKLFSFNIAKNPASVKIAEGVDVNTLPIEYIVFSSPTVNKAAVKEALKNGKELEWATLEQTEGLRIK